MSRHECKNCSEFFSGNFCPNCGQDAHEHRINAQYFLHDIPHSVLHVDNGFFYTIKKLFAEPGLMIKEYLDGKRIKYFRPIGFVMVITALSSLLVKLLDWCTKYYLESRGGNYTESHNFFEHYFSLFIFMLIPVASLVTWLTFVKKKYNFWEHFLANTYIAAQLNIFWILMHFLALVGALFTASQIKLEYSIFLTVFLIFFMYMYGRVFGFLMYPLSKNKFVLILMLCIMNAVLSTIYSYGFNVTGLFEN